MKTFRTENRFWLIALLYCILQTAGYGVYAQPVQTDSLTQIRPETADSLSIADKTVADSLQKANDANLQQLNSPTVMTITPDSTSFPPLKQQWIPNPTKATWLAIVFPGAGQIYNRKYWKLPIVYGGIAGCVYALNWNTNMYKDYTQAYLDIMDSDPNTNSYLNLIPSNYKYNTEQLKETIRKRKDMYRRYRDLSIFAFIGVYLISVIDAYVDAELSNFDITPDLSFRVEPTTFDSGRQLQGGKNFGLQCSLRF